ncbi:amidase domain-containing protein [Orenia metallireducens]|jgi:hypothetical protein|uniref:Amidase domain-containing protein n=1 Tax=Orenia metallireducens TaxID=1413210 RepID=A0A1C0A9L0_9FIRM|nr:amidase domain-containing protein [Orenia metallireducens]OCL26974.1 amidase domain-containing protein [Orenia metallireducens]
MFLLIKLNRRTVLLLSIFLLIFLGLGVYLRFLSKEDAVMVIDDEVKDILAQDIQNIFNIRNKALLERNKDTLKSLYNIEGRTGRWAYEHSLRKMEYLEEWGAKQGAEFKDINSQVLLRYAKEKGDGYSTTLLVSTEYRYAYEDSPEKYNSFRIGAYHAFDIIPKDDKWVISKEWYLDPTDDSLELDQSKVEEVKQIILSGETKDLSNLNKRRLKAVEYADKYCGTASLPKYGFKYNPNYRNFNSQGGNCANFASQILYEGAGFRKNRTWNYERGKGSKAWLNAHGFNQYMTYSGRASMIAHGTYEQVLKSSYKLLPGDYVAYEKKGKVEHISVVTGVDSKGYALVNCHNSDRYRVPWDIGWNKKGIKFRLVRVHY